MSESQKSPCDCLEKLARQFSSNGLIGPGGEIRDLLLLSSVLSSVGEALLEVGHDMEAQAVAKFKDHQG